MEMAWRPEASKVGRRGPPPSVERRKRSGSNLRGTAPLAVEVHRVEGRRRVEGVPPKAVQAPELLLHGGVAEREGGEVGNEDVLQLDVRVQPDALQHVGDQGLVGVVLQTSVRGRSG